MAHTITKALTLFTIITSSVSRRNDFTERRGNQVVYVGNGYGKLEFEDRNRIAHKARCQMSIGLLYDSKPMTDSCWDNSQKTTYCTQDFQTCINEDCLEPIIASNGKKTECYIPVGRREPHHVDCGSCAPAAVIPRRNGIGEVNFYADVTQDGCKQSTYNAVKNGTVECIEIKGYRISCESDPWIPGHNYGGVIMYDKGNYPHTLYPGYVILADTTGGDSGNVKPYLDWVASNSGQTREGYIHGFTVWKRFGQNPSQMSRQYGMKFAGFGIEHENGVYKLKFNSGSLNSASYWETQQRPMVQDEEVIVKALVAAWQKNGIAKSYWYSRLRPYICDALKTYDENTALTYSRNLYRECVTDVQAHFG